MSLLYHFYYIIKTPIATLVITIIRLQRYPHSARTQSTPVLGSSGTRVQQRRELHDAIIVAIKGRTNRLSHSIDLLTFDSEEVFRADTMTKMLGLSK